MRKGRSDGGEKGKQKSNQLSCLSPAAVMLFLGGTYCWSSRTLLQNQFLSSISIMHASTWQNKWTIDPTWWHLHEMIFRWSKVNVVYSKSQSHLHPILLECETGNSEHPHLTNSSHLLPVPNVPLRKSCSSGDRIRERPISMRGSFQSKSSKILM